jgi:copper chaperone NosL
MIAKRKLSLLVRVLVVLAALATLGSFFSPLWHYYFEAPQYPEGLAMSIWSYKLGGKVDLINGLNHYVGFMKLEASDFVEFKIFPVVIALLGVTGLVVAFLVSLRGLLYWLIGYGVFGVAALIDFYRWLYKFGHTIDPQAIIDVEGYTPPMIGSSNFMNFYIVSYPGLGAIVLIAALVLGVAAYFYTVFRKTRPATSNKQTRANAL